MHLVNIMKELLFRHEEDFYIKMRFIERKIYNFLITMSETVHEEDVGFGVFITDSLV